MNNLIRRGFPRLFLFCLFSLLILNACVTPAPTAPGSTQAAPVASATKNVESDAAQTKLAQAQQQAQAGAKGGVTKTSQEDVNTPRTQLGGEYHEVQTADAVSFHPYQTLDSPSFSYQGMVYASGLLRYDENTLELIPNMAESYAISEDGLTYTFKLRHGMQWSDGQPLTAQDFKWTWDQAMKPENEFPYLADYEFVTSFEAPDDYTLVVKTKQIHAPGLDAISGWTPLPKHIWEKLDWKDPEKNPEINKPSVSSGPYKLVEWQRDQHIIFEANDKYWYHGAPNISRYIIEIVPDQDVAFEKLKSGEVDTAEIKPEKLEEARTLDNMTLYEWWPARASWEYIGLNTREGFPTHDVHVRRGLAYAIDKELLTEQALLGMGKRQCSIYPATAWVFNPDVPCYDYNTDQALAEFKEAGYTFDGEKMLNAQGEQLTLKLLYGPNTSSTRELIAVTTQDYLSKIGIKVDIQSMEWSAYLDALAAEKPDWDMDIIGWDASIEPAFMCTLFDAKNIPNLNEVAYTNSDVDKLCAEAAATFDQSVRKEKYQVVQRLLAEDVPYIFLYYGKAWSGQSKRVQGIDPKLLGISWNRDNWYLAK
jgi:peptide/nickel transport system substrate-binding protein